MSNQTNVYLVVDLQQPANLVKPPTYMPLLQLIKLELERTEDEDEYDQTDGKLEFAYQSQCMRGQGVGRDEQSADLLDRTPTKIYIPFRKHTHTSFIYVRSESWEVRPTRFENGLRNGCRNARETVVL
jgi:hypothetical protein